MAVLSRLRCPSPPPPYPFNNRDIIYIGKKSREETIKHIKLSEERKYPFSNKQFSCPEEVPSKAEIEAAYNLSHTRKTGSCIFFLGHSVSTMENVLRTCT